MAKLSERKKVELLENAVLTHDTEAVKRIFDEYAPFELTARALGMACRYVGEQMVRTLCDLGAVFSYENSGVMARKYGCRIEISNSCSIPVDYSRWVLCMTLEEDAAHPVLSGAERAACAQVLYENRERIGLDEKLLLYYAALYVDQDVLDVLRAAGVWEIPEYRKNIITGITPYNVLDTAGRYYRSELSAVIDRTEDQQLFVLLNTLIALTDGEKLRFSKEDFYVYHYVKDKDVFVQRCCSDALFMLYAQHTNMIERVKKWDMLQALVECDNAQGLEWALQQRWLTKPAEFKKLFDDAVKKEASAAVVACALKYHNLNAETAKKSKKKDDDEFSLDGNPLSATELKKLWGVKKNEDGTLHIISYKGDEETVIVPEMIGRACVTSIGEETFSLSGARLTEEQIEARRKIRSAEFAEGIRKLPDNLFYGGFGAAAHDALEEVILPEGLEEIGASAFRDCTALKEIVLPQSLKAIGANAFAGCTALKEITLPERVEKLGAGVFSGCTSLHAVKLPSALTALSMSLFSSCSALGQIDLPEGICELPNYIFNGCGFTEYTVPAHITHLRSFAFAGCPNLKKIALHGRVTMIGDGAFAGCPLEEVTIPDSVEYIGSGAFDGCTQLERIMLPEREVHIGAGAFKGCTKLQDEHGLIVVSGALQSFEGDIRKPLRLSDAVRTVDEPTLRMLPRIVYRPSEEIDSIPDVSALQVGDEVVFGRFPQDMTLNLKPLVWQVIAQEGNRRLLMTRESIIAISDSYYSRGTFSLLQIGTWETSDVRTWLNSAFIETAFTPQECAHIAEVQLKNPDNKKEKISGGADTLDRVFLLSFDELMRYLPQDRQQCAAITPYAKAQWKTRRDTHFYLLRTPAGRGAVCVSNHIGGCIMTGNHVGVSTLRPAIWIE